MGTPDFAVTILKALLDAGEDIVAVVSQPDRPTGRHAVISPTRVKAEAIKHGLNMLQPERASDPDFIKKISALSPDAIVVAAYGKILKKDFLEIPRYGCINVHASLLPRWRGAAPIPWAIISGDEYTGVTIMQMDETMDTGDILLQRRIKIAPQENSVTLFEKLALMGGELILEALKKLGNGELVPLKQDDSLASYAPMLKKEMGHIEWSKSALSIERSIRGLYPWPGSFGYSNGRLIKIISAGLSDGPPGTISDDRKIISAGLSDGPPGTISDDRPGTVRVAEGRIFILTGDGWIEIYKLQPAGKNIMKAEDFLRGNTLTEFI